MEQRALVPAAKSALAERITENKSVTKSRDSGRGNRGEPAEKPSPSVKDIYRAMKQACALHASTLERGTVLDIVEHLTPVERYRCEGRTEAP